MVVIIFVEKQPHKIGYQVHPERNEDNTRVNSSSAHNSPFVLGSISPSCWSRLHPTRSARANALKIASIL